MNECQRKLEVELIRSRRAIVQHRVHQRAQELAEMIDGHRRAHGLTDTYIDMVVETVGVTVWPGHEIPQGLGDGLHWFPAIGLFLCREADPSWVMTRYSSEAKDLYEAAAGRAGKWVDGWSGAMPCA